MRVLLTGATGFIGRPLSVQLLSQGFDLTVALRKKSDFFTENVKQISVGDFSHNIDWSSILEEIDCIIHLAGKAHIVDSEKLDMLNEYYKINTKSTLNLASQAEIAGVKRLIFISSIMVNGNKSDTPFTENDIPSPKGPYAISKYKAEQGLFKISNKGNLDVVIIRPPMVYGVNTPGNFGRLVTLANSKISLPFPLIKNSRSILALDNLIDFIIICISHKKAANELFLISDENDLSTTELFQNLNIAFEKKTWILPIPVNFLVFIAKLIGREADSVRLFSSLQVDSSKAKKILGWKAKITTSKALASIVE